MSTGCEMLDARDSESALLRRFEADVTMAADLKGSDR